MCIRDSPCWDEPDFKAVFAVTLVVEPKMMAVSNGSVVSEQESHGKRIVRFADTMVMSSYLVAFVVGPLEATEWHLSLIHISSMTNELTQLHDAFGWGLPDFEWLTINAMKSAFAPFPERLKIINGLIKPRYALLNAEQSMGAL